MNLGQMKTALSRYAGVSTSDPLADWINAALVEFSEAYTWPFLDTIGNQDTLISDDVLTMPTDFFKLYSARVMVAGGVAVFHEQMKYVPYTTSEDEEPKANAVVMGEPYQYTLLGTDFMILYPIPEQVYTIRLTYRKMPVTLVGDSDVPGIPERYHYTIVEGAAVRALQAESEEERATVARGTFEDSIDRHITALGGRVQEGQFHQTRDVMGYGS